MTATQDQPAKPAAVNHAAPEPLDPENEIDAKSATWWFLIGAVVLFLSLWVMLPIFVRVQEEERKKKIDMTPNTELEDLLADQQQFLAGSNPKNLTIEQALSDALKK